MSVVLLGATKGMGRAVARQFAARGAALVLLGRDRAELERSAKDLEIRGAASSVGTVDCDLMRPESFPRAFDAAQSLLGRIETVVITAGLFELQERMEQDSQAVARLLTADFTNTILFCEEARRRLLAQGGGTLCVFSSVAGERARGSVVIYGAAKAGLSYYLEGIDHRYRRSGLKTVCVKPGFVHTEMTSGLKPPPFAGHPDAVARLVLRAIERGRPEVYVPPMWRLVMAVIRRLPRALMRRVSF